MIIKHNHKHVDMNGLVYLPYLHDWNVNSNLLQMVEVASAIFSGEPPLFSTASTVSNGASSSSSAAVVSRPSVAVTASVVSPAFSNNSPQNGATTTGYSATGYSAAAYPAAAYSAAAGSSHSSYPAVSAVSAVGYGSPAVVSAAPATNSSNNGSAYGQGPIFSTYSNSHTGAKSSYGVSTGYAALPTPPLPVAAAQPQHQSHTTSNSMFGLTNPSATAYHFIDQEQEQKRQLLAVEKHEMLVHQVNQKLRSLMQQKHEYLRDEIVKEMENERYLSSTNPEEKKKEMQGMIEELQQAVVEAEEKNKLLKEFQAQISSSKDAEGNSGNTECLL